jgi:hypothetical protein
VILLSCLAAGRAAAQNRSADEAALRHLKTVLWPQAYKEQDAALLDRILDDGFQSVDADGNWSNKRLELEELRRSTPSYDSLRFRIRRLDILENGTAVVAGTGTVFGRDSLGPYTVDYQSSNILIHRVGQWRAIASHVSGVQPPRRSSAPPRTPRTDGERTR